MNVQKIIRQTLYESKEKNLTIFYKVDVSITENLEKEQELEQPVEQPQVPVQQLQVQQPPLNPMPNEETIYEETFTSKAMGKLQVSEDEIDNIQSLEDLMDFLSKKSVKGNPVLNDAVAEIILNMATNGAQSIADLISKDDKIYISVDYGKEKNNSSASLIKAKAIANYFAAKGIPSEKITASGFGSANAIGTNKTKEGRKQNRRVEVVIK